MARCALSVGLAVLDRGHLPLPALLAGGLSIVLLGAGVVLLAVTSASCATPRPVSSWTT
jgi:hypothetical protein